eukprot:TRINITY_DN664_c1_g1_i5.p1 TRINITY_DN664_c1_g1~~TRINITY_DN664_c1_g1_i5.p1  ORF type:complete len:212 (-),score=47.11 TRINITY_DN664_c1_g1_i5:66-701(-)
MSRFVLSLILLQLLHAGSDDVSSSSFRGRNLQSDGRGREGGDGRRREGGDGRRREGGEGRRRGTGTGKGAGERRRREDDDVSVTSGAGNVSEIDSITVGGGNPRSIDAQDVDVRDKDVRAVQERSEQSGTSTVLLASAVGGSVFGVIVCVGIGLLCRRSRSAKKEGSPSTPGSYVEHQEPTSTFVVGNPVTGDIDSAKQAAEGEPYKLNNA